MEQHQTYIQALHFNLNYGVKMDLRGDDFKRSARAPAKLNLFLDVLGRRGDGFHDLETLMVPIRLADQVSLTPTPSPSNSPAKFISMFSTCWPVRLARARCRLFRRAPIISSLSRSNCFKNGAAVEFGARVELVKRIPMAAGLGGGSSDAAAALRLANRAWQINWDDDRLTELAAELGSDIPFFLSHGAAICRGRGERVERLPPLPPLYFVIVKPAEALGTGEVYGAHDSLAEQKPPIARGQLNRLIANLYRGGWHDVGHVDA